MLIESFPVVHSKESLREQLGEGLVVGDALVPVQNGEDGSIQHQLYYQVLWDKERTPVSMLPTDLFHVLDLSNNDEDEDEDEDENELEENEEEEEVEALGPTPDPLPTVDDLPSGEQEVQA